MLKTQHSQLSLFVVSVRTWPLYRLFYKKGWMYGEKTRHNFNGFYTWVFLGGKLLGPRGG